MMCAVFLKKDSTCFFNQLTFPTNLLTGLIFGFYIDTLTQPQIAATVMHQNNKL